MASLWLSQQIEERLHEMGFDIPSYPKQGDVKLDGEVVGYVDNFNGLTTRNKKVVEMLTAKGGFAIWNPTEVE